MHFIDIINNDHSIIRVLTTTVKVWFSSESLFLFILTKIEKKNSKIAKLAICCPERDIGE